MSYLLKKMNSISAGFSPARVFTVIGSLSILERAFIRRSFLSANLFAVLILLALADLCAAGERPAPQATAEWTLAFYLAGDNSLEYAQERNLREIIKGAAHLKKTHIVVLMDRDDFLDRENPLTSWRGTRVFNVTEPFGQVPQRPLSIQLPALIGKKRFEGLILDRMQDPTERRQVEAAYCLKDDCYRLCDITANQRRGILRLLIDRAEYSLPIRGREYVNLTAASEKTLRQFCCFVGDNFPARKYALFLSGHGSGWYEKEARPDPMNRHRKRVSAEYYQPLKSSALSAAAGWHHFDLIVMDSCLMADLETLWTLRNASDFLVLNQIETPSQGLDYNLLFEKIAAFHTVPDSRLLARAVVNAYDSAYRARPYPIASAAFETVYIDRLARQWNHFFQEAENASRLPPARLKLDAIPTVTGLKGAMVDLRGLCRLLGLGEMEAAIFGPSGVMIDCFQNRTSGNGLSIYLPSEKMVFDRTITAYRNTPWAQDFPDGWVRAVEKLFSGQKEKGSAGKAVTPRPRNP